MNELLNLGAEAVQILAACCGVVSAIVVMALGLRAVVLDLRRLKLARYGGEVEIKIVHPFLLTDEQRKDSKFAEVERCLSIRNSLDMSFLELVESEKNMAELLRIESERALRALNFRNEEAEANGQEVELNSSCLVEVQYPEFLNTLRRVIRGTLSKELGGRGYATQAVRDECSEKNFVWGLVVHKLPGKGLWNVAVELMREDFLTEMLKGELSYSLPRKDNHKYRIRELELLEIAKAYHCLKKKGSDECLILVGEVQIAL